MSLEIPKREHATGIKRREPPAIPDAPHAESVAKILNTIAVGMLTLIPSVYAVSYTHLDVYKRQAINQMYPLPTRPYKK